jgi:hypothetical protein
MLYRNNLHVQPSCCRPLVTATADSGLQATLQNYLIRTQILAASGAPFTFVTNILFGLAARLVASRGHLARAESDRSACEAEMTDIGIELECMAACLARLGKRQAAFLARRAMTSTLPHQGSGRVENGGINRSTRARLRYRLPFILLIGLPTCSCVECATKEKDLQTVALRASITG